MLNAADYRPTDTTTVYMTDWNTATITAQMKAYSTKLSDAVDAGNLTVTKRTPTQSLMAALVITVSGMVLTKSELVVFMEDVARSFGQDIEYEVDTGQIGIAIEDYEPSAVRAQVEYTVSDLPA
jgi:hypothetical protein